MKQTIVYLLIATLAISCSSCKKNVTTTDNNGLPAATQEGKNTLGFMINGQVWTPKGFDGTSNLSIDVDFGIDSGTFDISAYRIGESSKSYFGIGIADSLNLLSPPTTLPVNKQSITKIRYSSQYCSTDFFDTTIYRSGSLTINKLDKTNRIIAGTFNAILYKPGCDTFKITDGRFDMKY